MQERTISLEGLNLTVAVKYASYEMTKRRPPAGKSNRLFGSKIQDVCRCGALHWGVCCREFRADSLASCVLRKSRSFLGFEAPFNNDTQCSSIFSFLCMEAAESGKV